MKLKRNICMLLAILVLCAATPTQGAAASTTKILGTNGRVTAALRTTGQIKELVYTTDGVNWQPCTVEGDSSRVGEITYGSYQWGDFRATSFGATLTNSVLYRSDDGIHWQPDQGETWFLGDQERACCSCGPYDFQLEENRLYYTGGMVVSELPAVAAEASKRGLDYDEVRAYPVGEEYIAIEVYDRWDGDGRNKLTMTYTRDSLDWVQGADWDKTPGDVGALVSDGTVMLARRQNITPDWMGAYQENSYSYDGRVWHLVRLPEERTLEMGGPTPYNGKTLMLQDAATGELYYATDPAGWKQIPVSERFPRDTLYADYTFLWTGGEYISCQSLIGRTWMFGHAGNPDFVDPYANFVSFFDEDFRELSRQDLGERVRRVGYVDGVWYAMTQGGENGHAPWAELEQPYTVWSSTNKVDWIKTGLTEIPQALPEGVKALGEGDVLAAPYVFRLSGSDLLVSRDGVDFVKLDAAPQPGPEFRGHPATPVLTAVSARDGVLVMVEWQSEDVYWTTRNGVRNYARETVESVLNGTK